jgi:hypothetical protein
MKNVFHALLRALGKHHSTGLEQITKAAFPHDDGSGVWSGLTNHLSRETEIVLRLGFPDPVLPHPQCIEFELDCLEIQVKLDQIVGRLPVDFHGVLKLVVDDWIRRRGGEHLSAKIWSWRRD